MSFTQLNLTPEILHAIADQGYTDPTPIQAQAIPRILEGRDIMGAAQTGTGKTAGFTLPMLNLLQPGANTSASPARHPIRTLILVPTRELAIQVHESVKTYGKYLPLRYAAVYGGVDMEPQARELRAGIEILVATPGRLLDHVQQKAINLSKVEILILDEADRMLDMGFLPDIKRILALLPPKRQSLMFSATFSDEIKKLAGKLLREPVLVEVAKRNTITELITHVVHPVVRERKRELLAHIIKSQDLKQVLVFARTKHGASRLANQLERDHISATAIHGDKTQPQRTEALTKFKQGEVRVLVATDVAARGLDIEELPHVVNFELPTNPEDYVHRIGRTGRAGTKGDAVSLVCEDEAELLKGIEKLLKFKLESKAIPGFGPETTVAQGEAATSHGRIDHRSNQPTEKKSAGSQPRGLQSRKLEQANSIMPPNGTKGKTARSSKEYAGSRKTGKLPEDPLFTQPYTPDTFSGEPSDRTSAKSETSPPEKRFDYFGHKQQKKPIPALFMPPRSQSKQEQEG
jgi:ATP-dependent RNA helicase RhlE